jgi:ABC-type antimicrobial peptide transport system permease subunit
MGAMKLVGSSLIIGGHPFTLVGITPPGFFGDTLRSEPPDLWLPIQQELLLNPTDSLLNSPGAAWVRIIGRLRHSATISGISPRLTGILRQWLLNESAYPAVWIPEVRRTLPDQHIDIIPATGGVTEMKGEYQRSLRILFAVCVLVLLIACTDIANLQLARQITRRRLTALRIAVGASRKRILRLSLVESLLLALLGSAAGLIGADAAVQLIVNLAFPSSEFLLSVKSSSAPILLFSLESAFLTSVVFGAAPASLASHTDPVEALRGGGRATRDESSLPRQVFLVLQAAFSVWLVVVAGLLTHSLSNLQHQEFGFETINGINVQLDSAPAPYNLSSTNRPWYVSVCRVVLPPPARVL